MKLFSTMYRNSTQLAEFVTEHDIARKANVLVQVFSGVLDCGALVAVLRHLGQLLPDAVIVGATTTGEILEGVSHSESIVISISVFNSSHVRAIACPNATPTPVLDGILNDQVKLLLMLSAGIDLVPTEMLHYLGKRVPDAFVAGGCAGDNDRLQQTWVFLGQKVIERGVVVVAISGGSFYVKPVMKFNWEPMGSEMIVTDAEGDLVRTINGFSVAELYGHYFGKGVETNLISISSVFPLMRKRGDIHVSNILLEVDENGACLFSGRMGVGEQVVFGCADVDMLLDNTYLEHALTHHIEAIWAYSCGGRKKILQKEIDKELLPLARLAPTAGFFTYGEFFTAMVGQHEILNNTMTFVGLSENPYERQHRFMEQEQRIQSDLEISPRQIFQAMTHFANAVAYERDESYRQIAQYAAELDVKNAQLERLYMTDRLTGINNRYKLDAVLSERLSLFQRYATPFSVVLFDVDKFKSINDTHGHTVGDDVLCTLAGLVKTHVRDTDFFGRWGGEEFLLICSEALLEGGKDIAEKMRGLLERHRFNVVERVTASFGVSQCQVGDNATTLLARADQALYSAKHNGRNRVEVLA
ncbi:MAG: diguanylate cyclase [Magnetococcales bacterium]|nr:diguanylate cyclase [Magnetococcales bacterium]MBF0322936.1 diguanylate cyclase [Magnetococcales bacterium]